MAVPTIYSDTMEIIVFDRGSTIKLGRATGRKNRAKFPGFFHEDYQQMKAS
jgi:hypothetical protein